jgi:hypothetical protein
VTPTRAGCGIPFACHHQALTDPVVWPVVPAVLMAEVFACDVLQISIRWLA